MHFHFGQTFVAPAFQGVSHTTGGGSFLDTFLWCFFCNTVMWSSGANPGFTTAWAVRYWIYVTAQIPGFIFVVN